MHVISDEDYTLLLKATEINKKNRELEKYLSELAQKREDDEYWEDLIKQIDHSYKRFKNV